VTDDPYLTLEEAAAYVGGTVTKGTVRNWINDGRLRGFRLGPRLLRVRKSDVDGLLTELPPANKEVTQ
jgi:excisionase family DNA binding protein